MKRASVGLAVITLVVAGWWWGFRGGTPGETPVRSSRPDRVDGAPRSGPTATFGSAGETGGTGEPSSSSAPSGAPSPVPVSFDELTVEQQDALPEHDLYLRFADGDVVALTFEGHAVAAQRTLGLRLGAVYKERWDLPAEADRSDVDARIRSIRDSLRKVGCRGVKVERWVARSATSSAQDDERR